MKSVTHVGDVPSVQSPGPAQAEPIVPSPIGGGAPLSRGGGGPPPSGSGRPPESMNVITPPLSRRPASVPPPRGPLRPSPPQPLTTRIEPTNKPRDARNMGLTSRHEVLN